eukprot:TRINITY_DN5891_c0_g1_i1.p1 TRINITY_DN5891_c0_g1~~TRINITY_DN5891_c0_g1_i1.p1  ORF type:complete len:112 (+),score=16.90 TRINITY_DN5891_c0_g1_i1:79-414(+)
MATYLNVKKKSNYKTAPFELLSRRTIFEEAFGGGNRFLWGVGFVLFSVGWIYSTYYYLRKNEREEKIRLEKKEIKEQKQEERREKISNVKSRALQFRERFRRKKNDDNGDA